VRTTRGPPTEPRRLAQAVERAKAMRQSVDITRLSRIALNNLEKDSDTRQARTTDIHLDNPDTELTFQEVAGDEGECPPGVGARMQRAHVPRIPSCLRVQEPTVPAHVGGCPAQLLLL
jgi:hypothetical protein